MTSRTCGRDPNEVEALRRIGVKEHALPEVEADPWQVIDWLAVNMPRALELCPYKGQAMTTGITDDLREAAERVRRDVRTRLAEVEAEQKRLRGDLDHLDAFLDGRTYSPERGLKGAKLGRAARDVLRAGGPMHYRDVFERIRAVSEIGGRDPLATTLTAITRDPYVRVNGSRSGVYALIEEE